MIRGKPIDFAIFIATAEERGRIAGVRFHSVMSTRDPVTAEIFRKIADEEVAHVALAETYYPGSEVLWRATRSSRDASAKPA